MKRFISALAAVVLVAFAGSAYAHEQVYSAILSGPAESPPNASPATGNALITFDLDLVTMRVQADFTGLLGTTSASHIHGVTALPNVGTAGVATVTPTFTGFPLGVTSGTYDHTFDMTIAASYNPSFVTAQGSVSNALNALLFGSDASKTYLNIHTSAFPGGEIRGFLTPVPEPASCAVFAIGTAAFVRRRR